MQSLIDNKKRATREKRRRSQSFWFSGEEDGLQDDEGHESKSNPIVSDTKGLTPHPVADKIEKNHFSFDGIQKNGFKWQMQPANQEKRNRKEALCSDDSSSESDISNS